MFRPPTPLVKNLLIVNIGIAVVQFAMGLDLGRGFGLYFLFSDNFQPYQFVTYMFLHDTGSMRHIFGNMLILFFVGPMLENFLGQKKFLILYMVTGLGGGILYTAANYVEVSGIRNDVQEYATNPNPEDFNRLIVKHVDRPSEQILTVIDNYARNEDNPRLRQDSVNWAYVLYNQYGDYPMVGASGAVFGILAMLMILFPNTEILLFFTIPVKIKFLVGALIIYEVFSEFERAPGDNVAHLAHLGGALFAWILFKVWKQKRGDFY